MAVDISALVTANWPTTEALLSADSNLDYEVHKAVLVNKAKRRLYQAKSVPSSEDDIPERAAYWIADQATVYLIPVGISWYLENSRVSENKEGATITFHNRVQALKDLRTELEADLREGLEAAQGAIDAREVSESTPAVDHDGMAVDPLSRAMGRGPW